MSMHEARARGWDEIDIVFVTGDAYIDHPSFAMAILGRVLEACGFRVGIIAQPDWHSCEPWKTFGRPRLFFAISAGNMDSMINHYTANKKVRNDDAYSPGGRIGLRPDRATLAYCQRTREAYKGVPIIAGGVEASLRRLAHYDYWSDTVKRSILLDAKADLVVFGMGESAIVEIARRLDAGELLHDLRDMRGVAYALGAAESNVQKSKIEVQSDGERKDSLCAWQQSNEATRQQGDGASSNRQLTISNRQFDDSVRLPSFEEVRENKLAFAEATRLIHLETNPYNARPLIQWHGDQAVLCNPPRLPESRESMDFIYDLPYTRKAHPIYKEPIPAFEVVKDSVTIMRGCFGGCTYCSITTHQGRIIQSRSKESIVGEVAQMGSQKEFKGVISDIGGPTANMYEMRCVRPEIEAICRRLSCVHPKVCPLLGTDHGPLIDVMRESRSQKGIRKVFVASGVRMDLARLSPEYMHELTTHHVGGHLKVAQEHSDATTLTLMKRPAPETFQDFDKKFREESKRAGKKQYLVPYFISAHPGTDLNAMIDLAVFLKRNGYKPEQVQDFIPAPFDIAACMYHTGLDPMTKKPVAVAKGLRDRKLQRSLMQFFKPENYFLVRKALLEANRPELIGAGCDCLIPAHPPQAAIDARRAQAARESRRAASPLAKGGLEGDQRIDTPVSSSDGDHVHSQRRYLRPGYRPHRKSVQ
ncbi:MAG: YgiQ family radical SAM protein [Planctomycetes bacterium]|nr:YgiQ family radical SAM protein [Planctomycetota bacterium]